LRIALRAGAIREIVVSDPDVASLLAGQSRHRGGYHPGAPHRRHREDVKTLYPRADSECTSPPERHRLRLLPGFNVDQIQACRQHSLAGANLCLVTKAR